MIDRRSFLGGALAAGVMPVAGASAKRGTCKFILMSDTHVESDFLERGRPVYTCWQPGDYAALTKTYEFINTDVNCGTMTSKNAAFAVVEISDDRAVFDVYGRAAASQKKDGSGFVVCQTPKREFSFEIPLKPIRT